MDPRYASSEHHGTMMYRRRINYSGMNHRHKQHWKDSTPIERPFTDLSRYNQLLFVSSPDRRYQTSTSGQAGSTSADGTVQRRRGKDDPIERSFFGPSPIAIAYDEHERCDIPSDAAFGGRTRKLGTTSIENTSPASSARTAD